MAADVKLGAWFGKREVMRAEACNSTLSIDFFHNQIQRGFQVGHCDTLVNNHSFNLVEHRRMRGIHFVLAVDTPRCNHADGKSFCLHCMHLHRRGLRAEENAAVLAEIESIRPLSRGMGFINVQFREVVVGKLHFIAVKDFKPHADKYVLNLVEHIVHRVFVAKAYIGGRQGNINCLIAELFLQQSR